MKAHARFEIILAVLIILLSLPGKAQTTDTTIYLITCGPGTADGAGIYSIYGHSALMVNIEGKDTVYNWGVFDFDTKNFAWKFAKGRLDYMLAAESLNRFLRGYFYEKRYVLAQEINLYPHEKRIVLDLINENLKPENVKYRYDFFYDDCSTRIRDLIEKSAGDSLTYPENAVKLTFRDLIGEYQQYYPWLQFGVDLLVGSPSDKEADIRDRMFLPDYLMSGLSDARVSRNGSNVPLLGKPIKLLDFEPPVVSKNIYTSPLFVFSILFVIITFLSLRFKSAVHQNMMDYTLFFIFAVLAVMMIFFNFFTDHKQLRSNYNILWLNPFLVIFFISLLTGKIEILLARMLFFISIAFLVTHILLPQAFNAAIYPLLLIIILRTMARSDFRWSPFKHIPFTPDGSLPRSVGQ